MAHNNLTYAERGHRALKDARWYANDGWYTRTKYALRRRIETKRQRMEMS